jgi:predicted CXXCH cytochrome family protein
MGCTGCHRPHSTDKPKLLPASPPDLCYTCHDKGEFSKKLVHAPVKEGACLSCHGTHSTDAAILLKKEPIQVCLDCHGNVEKKPHAIRGFNNDGHPIGKKDKKDPKRPDKKFSCSSCHNPHSSESVKLFRYPAKSTMGLCINCHKY